MVSVIVPNYNHASYLPKRLESIANQTYTNFECILLDDASTDDSLSILKDITSRDSRFSLYINKVNSGSTFAQWNYGISLAKRKYIWIAESDDYADTNFLSTLITAFEREEKLVLAYSQSNMIDSYGKFIGDWKYNSSVFNSSFTEIGLTFIQNQLLITNVIPNASAVVFLRESYIKVGQAIPSLLNNGDWHLWLKLLTTGKVYFTTQKLNYFRQHSKSVTYIAKSNHDFFEKFDVRITELRNQYNLYLQSLKEQYVKPLVQRNNLLLSYEWGNYALYLKKKKKFLTAFSFILKATFFPKFKSYFLKKFIFGRHYNYLFKG